MTHVKVKRIKNPVTGIPYELRQKDWQKNGGRRNET
jgi:hypothetical protein